MERSLFIDVTLDLSRKAHGIRHLDFQAKDVPPASALATPGQATAPVDLPGIVPIFRAQVHDGGDRC
jgi:hypothetical protein